jgi:hypothetical protein
MFDSKDYSFKLDPSVPKPAVPHEPGLTWSTTPVEDFALGGGLQISKALFSLGKIAFRSAVALVTKEAAEEGTTALATTGLRLSAEAVKRMGERGVTEDMIETVLAKGARFWDPKNGTIQYVIEGGMASGKSILVAQNPTTGVISTVIVGRNLVSSRFVPMP